MAQEIDERLKLILSQPGVTGYVIINHEGIPMKTSIPEESVAVQYAALLTRFVQKVKASVKAIDPFNDMKWARLRSDREEIVITPEKEFIVAVIQKPTI